MDLTEDDERLLNQVIDLALGRTVARALVEGQTSAFGVDVLARWLHHRAETLDPTAAMNEMAALAEDRMRRGLQ